MEETLDDERGRQQALAERLAEVVAEGEGSKVDEQVFVRMDPEDVALVRETLEEPSVFDEFEAEEDADFLALEPDEEEQNEVEEEIARLQAEIAASQRRQLAYERYLEALDS
jgi:hypothetical protein